MVETTLWQELGRRAGPRSSIPFQVSVGIPGAAPLEPARICDLSAQGISIFSPMNLEPAHEIEIVLYVPYEMTLTEFLPVRFKARVLRAEGDVNDYARRFSAQLLMESETALAISRPGNA